MLNGRFFRMQKLKEECEKKRHEEFQKESCAEVNLDPGKSLSHQQLEQMLGSHWRSKL